MRAAYGTRASAALWKLRESLPGLQRHLVDSWSMLGTGRRVAVAGVGNGSRDFASPWSPTLSGWFLFTFFPTPVFLPGESQGWGSLVGCHLWGCTELDTTEVT